MRYIKCETCGDYSEPTEHDIRLHGIANKPDLCDNCIEETKHKMLEYDASECGYDSVDEYLFRENYRDYFK